MTFLTVMGDWMLFESGRSMGRAGTLLTILTAFIAPAVIVAALFLGVLSNIVLLSAAFGVVSFLGQILFLLGMNRLAQHYGKPAIFKNALYGFLLGVIGSVAYTIFVYWSLSSLRSLQPTITPGNPSTPSFLLAFFVYFVVIFVGAFVLLVIQSVFYRWAFNALAEASGEGNFRQAGLFMLLGAVLTIIIVGALIFFIGWIFAFLGFSHMKQQPSQQAPPVGRARFCPNCGKENLESDAFCSRCGTRLWQE